MLFEERPEVSCFPGCGLDKVPYLQCCVRQSSVAVQRSCIITGVAVSEPAHATYGADTIASTVGAHHSENQFPNGFVC